MGDRAQKAPLTRGAVKTAGFDLGEAGAIHELPVREKRNGETSLFAKGGTMAEMTVFVKTKIGMEHNSINNAT